MSIFQCSCSRTINATYGPTLWSGNGPIMLTTSIRHFCPGVKFEKDSYTQCGNFTVLPQGRCFEIFYPEWQKFFEAKNVDEVMGRLEKSKSYFTHLYNKMSFFANKTYQIRHDSEVAYVKLARQYCPKVYETMIKYF